MASGFGKNKVGRCYSIFSTFETCMVSGHDWKRTVLSWKAGTRVLPSWGGLPGLLCLRRQQQ